MMILFIFISRIAHPSSDKEDAIQKLVHRAQEGDSYAAAQLYHQHVDRVFRAVRPLCSSDGETEDVVQEAFIKAFKSLSQYTPRKEARFLSWLLKIAINTAKKRLKSSWRKNFVTTDPSKIEHLKDRLNPGIAFQHFNEAENMKISRKKALIQALEELEPQARQVLTLRYGAGLSASEVGQTCGIKETYVRKICQRQKGKLLERINQLIELNENEQSRTSEEHVRG